jgi:hypothetical protein
MLRHAWDYWHTLDRMSLIGPGFGQLRELARAIDGYAVVAAKQGHEAEGVRAARVGLGLGRKLLGTWPVRDATPLDDTVLQALVGVAIMELSYDALGRVYSETGNAAQVQTAAAESAAFQRARKAHTAAALKDRGWTVETIQAYLWKNY